MSQKGAKQSRKTQELEVLLRQSEERCAALEKENQELRQKMDRLTEQFLNAQRARFGQSSEKSVYVMEGGEQPLTLLVGMQTSTATIENSVEIP